MSTPGRTLWIEVINRRKAWDTETQPDSMESWPAADIAWQIRLDDVVGIALDARSGGDVDPRAALIDVLAVASAWIDQMG